MDNENQNQEPRRFDNPQEASNPYQPKHDLSMAPQGQQIKQPKKHMALAVASVVLGGLSLCCCWLYVVGIIPAVIGAVFGLISLIGGVDKKVKILGGVGMGLGIIGIGLSLIMLVTYIAIINWDNVTLQNMETIRNVNPDDEQELRQWLQQFFNTDISSYY